MSDDIPVMRSWAVETMAGIRMVGRCPRCRTIHVHGTSADPLRVPNCPTGSVWHPDVGGTASSIRLFHLTGAPPEDVWREFWSEPADCLMMARAALERSRWTQERSRIAFRAIVDSGVVDERIGALADSVSEHRAWRIALAEFIRSCRGRRMRWRLAAALERAHNAALCGEVAERGLWPVRDADEPRALGVAGLSTYFQTRDGETIELRARRFTEANLLRLAPYEFWMERFSYPGGRRKDFDRSRAADYCCRLAVAAGPYDPPGASA